MRTRPIAKLAFSSATWLKPCCFQALVKYGPKIGRLDIVWCRLSESGESRVYFAGLSD